MEEAWEQDYIESEVKSTVPGAFVHKLQHAHLFVRSLKPKTLKVPLKVHSCSIHQNWYAQNFWVPKANLVNYDLAKIVQTGIYQCTELLASYPRSSPRSLGTRLLSYNIHLKYQQLIVTEQRSIYHNWWCLISKWQKGGAWECMRPTSVSIIPYSNPTSILHYIAMATICMVCLKVYRFIIQETFLARYMLIIRNSAKYQLYELSAL